MLKNITLKGKEVRMAQLNGEFGKIKVLIKEKDDEIVYKFRHLAVNSAINFYGSGVCGAFGGVGVLTMTKRFFRFFIRSLRVSS